MMMQGLKLASLFAGYALVGFGGDYVYGLYAMEPQPSTVQVEVGVEAEVEPAARVVVSEGRIRFGDGRCDYEGERVVTLAASADDLLRLSAGSGELRVEGREGLREVRATGRLCASAEDYLDEMTLTADRRGDEIVLTAHYPDRSTRRSVRGNDVARIDLTVEIPLDMAVDLDDSSGGMEVIGTGALRIDDSSGSVWVERIRGPVFIDDSSGDVDVRDVVGDVEIEDGSGSIEVADVTGEVRLSDGSGSISVSGVERDVIVERDGSGSISVRDVRGDFSVLRDGSGSIRHSGVMGAVEIPRDKRSRRGRGG